MMLDEITWVEILHRYLKWIFAPEWIYASEDSSLRALLPKLYELEQHLEAGEPYHSAPAMLKAAALAELCDRAFDLHADDLKTRAMELDEHDKKAKKDSSKSSKKEAKRAKKEHKKKHKRSRKHDKEKGRDKEQAA